MNKLKLACFLIILIFSSILCFIEIPKMLNEKLYRELWSFSIILVLGITLSILKCLDVEITNPSDWIAWVYSPVSDFLRQVLQ